MRSPGIWPASSPFLTPATMNCPRLPLCGDTAYPLACEAVRTGPGPRASRLQEGEAGFNPKVNQLACLARAARHHLLW